MVAEIVDRFVNTEAETQAFGIRIITLGSPNWRAKSHMVLKSVPVQSQGSQAWLLAKEDASMLMADLRRRSDFREHSSPHLLVHNGQSAVVTLTRPHNYIRNVTLHPNAWPGFTPEQGQIDEGFSLEFNPLLSVDSRTVDCMLKCHVDQIEKMVGVDLNVPSAAAPRQRTHIEVPQMSSVRLHERFRWPVDHVMLVSLGVVASPAPAGPDGIAQHALAEQWRSFGVATICRKSRQDAGHARRAQRRRRGKPVTTKAATKRFLAFSTSNEAQR